MIFLTHPLSGTVYNHVTFISKSGRQNESSQNLMTDQAFLCEYTGTVVKLVTLDSCCVKFD